jgi:hypothetical protein
VDVRERTNHESRAFSFFIVALTTGDPQFEDAVRSEVGAWTPASGPDVHDLMVRVDHRAWRAPVALASAIGAASVAVLLLLSLAMVLLGPAVPGGETLKAHLVSGP